MTPKRAAFVKEYPLDLNATKAAERAGFSPKTAYSQGQRLLKNVEVQRAIQAEMAARSERTEVSADRVLEEIALAAFLDPVTLFAEDGTLLPLSQMPPYARRAIAGIEVEELWEGRGDDRRMIGFLKKIKLVSKEGTLTLAGRHLGMFTDKTEVSGSVTVQASQEDEKL